MKICLALPVYNEEAVLKKNLETLLVEVQKYSGLKWLIVISDNGSRDRTREIAQEVIATHPNSGLAYIYNPHAGKGGAIKRAWLETPADWYFFMDVDLAIDLKALAPLVELIANDRADIIVGSRYVPGSTVERRLIRTIVSEVYNFLCRRVIHLAVTDAQCGWKAVKHAVVAEIVPHVTNHEWFFDTELLALAQAQHKQIVEMPVEWVETRDGTRPSKVRLIKTTWQYVRLMMKLRKRLVAQPPDRI